MEQTTTPKTKGGARPNCGRKPLSDKKVQLYVFVRQSKIDKLGGKEATLKKLNKAIGNQL